MRTERKSNDAPSADRRISNPAACFASPEELLASTEIAKEEKIAALRNWAYDAAEMCVAVEEGMRGGNGDLLRRVLIALEALGEKIEVEHAGPTKQHGLPSQ